MPLALHKKTRRATAPPTKAAQGRQQNTKLRATERSTDVPYRCCTSFRGLQRRKTDSSGQGTEVDTSLSQASRARIRPAVLYLLLCTVGQVKGPFEYRQSKSTHAAGSLLRYQYSTYSGYMRRYTQPAVRQLYAAPCRALALRASGNTTRRETTVRMSTTAVRCTAVLHN